MSLPKSMLLTAMAAALFLSTFPISAAGGAADAKVQAQLDQKKTPYKIDEDGDFRITVRLQNERTQLVWVRSAVEKAGTISVREIWSPGYKSPQADFSATIANLLLTKSDRLKMGSWVKQENMAMLVVKIPANATADQLDDAVDYAATVADEMESELTGKDDL